MKLKFVTLLVFLLKIVQIDCYADVKALATSLKTLTFKSRLSTTLIDRLYPLRILDCVKACVVRPRCKSINYRYKYQMCDLNSGDSTTNPGDIIHNEIGVIYGEVFKWSPNVLTGDPCSGVTCPALSKCDPTPPCVISDCGDPLLPDNATSSGDGTAIGRSQKLSCNAGYKLQGNDRIICQPGGTWTTVTATCIIDCGTPQTITNASAPSYTSTTYMSTATYTCDSGYTLSGGSGQITCQAGGTWDTITFSCDVQDCGQPQTLANANPPSHTTTTYLSTATYTCNTGYSLSGGSGQITCGVGGAWDTIVFTCDIPDCGQPPALANADSPSYTTTTYLSTVTYTCLTGYSLSAGSGQITCGVGGVWDNITFTCDIQDCGQPQTLPNANPSSYTTTTYLSTATYTCVTGYTFSGGSGQITCGPGGAWDNIVFVCNIQDCGQPPALPNGDPPSYTTTTYLSTAVYTCVTGYSLSAGSGQITCGAGGAWDIIAFTCDIQDCGQPQTLPNANSPSYTTTTYSSTAIYTCLDGYSLSAGSGQITCGGGGAWENIMFTCNILDCGQPPALANANPPSYITTTYLSTATYACLSGYSLGGGSGQITCGVGGVWNIAVLNCNIQDCGQPPALANANTPSYTTTTYLSTATYTCNTGYSMSGGSGQITCGVEGAWDIAVLNCNIQDTAVVACASGDAYSSGAPDIISSVCRKYICKNCGQPQTLLANANPPSYTTTTYLSTATYTCLTGYSLSAGSGQITCGAGGAWANIAFTCIIQDCGVPATVTNANSPVYTTTTYQSTAIYTCNTGYTMSGGTAVITCVNLGGTIAWETPTFSCNLPADCSSSSVLEPSSGTCYWMPTSSTMTALTCYNTCNDQNANVAEVTDSIQETFVKSTFLSGTSGLWIGVNDRDTELNWVTWKTGSPAQTYFNWASGQPNGYPVGTYESDCVIIATYGQWEDRSCTYSGHKYHCLCSYRNDVPLTDCGVPTTITNGQVSYTGTTYQSIATFTCNSGYTLQGSNQIICNGLTWDPDPSTISCTLHGCGDPPEIRGAKVTGTGTIFGSIRTYTCDAGYTSSGTDPFESVCTSSTGTWTPLQITCTECSSSSALGTTYRYVENRYFKPPGVSFVPSVSGSTLTVDDCKQRCIDRTDFTCVVFYFNTTRNNYCVLWDTRVSDDPSYAAYYSKDDHMDEYTRECLTIDGAMEAQG